MDQLKILIAGPGIGGLSAAAAMQNRGIYCRIIEKEPLFGDRGYAMTIQGEGIRALDTLGLLEKIKNNSAVRHISRILTPGYFPEIIEVWSRKKLTTFYPLKDGVSVSFFKKISKDYQSQEKYRNRELIQFFGDIKIDSVRYILETVKDNIYYSPVRNIRVPGWYKERIILLGDAAHGVSPLTGMGANLAIADSVALAEVLSEYKETAPGEMEKKVS